MRYVCLASLRFRTDESTVRFPLWALAYRYYSNDRHPAGRESFLNGEPNTCASVNPVTELLYWEELNPTRTPSQRIIQVAITAGGRFPSAIKRSLALLSCHQNHSLGMNLNNLTTRIHMATAAMVVNTVRSLVISENMKVMSRAP